MADQPLPPKEAALFKQLVRCYETKQNKRGLKHAEQILKKQPEHGETLAMKGLLLSQQDHHAKKVEAYELVRRAIKNDLKSQVCWHVYGLLCRADRDYLQAIKAYRGALRQDPENVKILRDLSMLQVHMRDVAGFVETRNTLLTLKPTNKINWITFAVAKHLAKDYMGAIGVLEAYENTLKGTPPPETMSERYEHSEMLLYKNELFVEAGRPHKALAHLDEISAQVVDKTGLTHRRAELMLKLGRFEEARKLYEGLVERNVENIQSHAGLQAATLRRSEAVGRWLDVEVDSATEATLSELYARLRAAHPRSNVVRRLPLDFVRATDAFRELFAAYAVPYLRKGVPSLFADIKPLRARPETLGAVCTLADEWLASLEQTGCLPGEPARELPSTIVWTRALVAQLADLCGDSARAFELIDAAIEHTPTCLDLYIVKARVHKHAGNLQAAADVMNTAREMDLQDRYLNTKSTRYMLRADRIADAAANIAPFSSDSNNLSNLSEMQCMWYENETGAAHLRRGEHGKALKNFALVEKHFLDIVEDQYDFHHYCLRKMTLRAYVKMLRLEDELYSQQLFVSAAYGAIDTYLQLDSSKKAVAAAAAAASKTATEGMSAAEMKKAESKRKKAEARAKAEAEAAAKAAPALHTAKGGGAAKGAKKGGKDAPIDDDPDGKLLVAKDAVEGASRYLATLLAHAPNRLRTQTYAVAIYLSKGKLLLALRAIRRIVELARDSPAAHRSVTRFLHAAALAKAEGPVASVISTQLAAIGVTEGTSASQYNDAYLSKAGSDFAAIVAWAEMKLLLEPAQKKDAVSKLVGASLATASLEGCKEAVALLGSADVDAADRFRKSAQLRFPYAGNFQSKPAASVGGGNA